MGIVSSSLRSISESMVNSLQRATDPMQTQGTTRADVKLVGNQYSEAKVRTFSVTSGEPSAVGGGDEGPNPLEYFASSIGFCENVTFERNAALMGVDVDSLETSVRGHYDRKGQWGIGGAEPSFSDIMIEMKITTHEPAEKIIELVKLVHKRCPMHATISKATKVSDKLVINGREVALQLP
jgi:uncharacterized OsmC-like protein